MIKNDFWNERYSLEDYVYGTEPNQFLKNYLENLPVTGKILFPGEGEGRNAVYASKKGWYVEAFDSSDIACRKAMELAKKHNVKISYTVEDFLFYTPKNDFFNIAGVFFVHLPRVQRRNFSVKMWESLKPGGKLIMQVFSKEQLNLSSGGPKDIALLYSETEIIEDFPCFRIESMETVTIDLHEGKGHAGKASVIQFVGTK